MTFRVPVSIASLLRLQQLPTRAQLVVDGIWLGQQAAVAGKALQLVGCQLWNHCQDPVLEPLNRLQMFAGAWRFPRGQFWIEGLGTKEEGWKMGGKKSSPAVLGMRAAGGMVASSATVSMLKACQD